MSKRDSEGFLVALFLLFIVGGFLFPLSAASTAKSSGWGKVIYTIFSLALIGLAVAAWCLVWPIWLAVVLTVAASFAAVGLALAIAV